MLLTEKLVKFRRQNKPSPSDLNNKEKQELVSKLREYFEKREGDERLEDSSSEGTCQIDGLSFPQPSFGGITFTSGEIGVTHVAFIASEALFIYPSVPSRFFGEKAIAWLSSSKCNKTVKVIENRLGAAGVVQGASSSGLSTNVLIPSEGLFNLVTNMYAIGSSSSPLVFHVSVRSATQKLIVESADCGINAAISMLSSGSAQEAYDMAIVAQIAAKRLSRPFLHFFECPSGETKIRTLSAAKLEELFFKLKKEPSNYEPSAVARVVGEVMKDLETSLSTQYAPFNFYGSTEATHLIVATGEAAFVTSQVLDYLKDPNVALLNVRLYSPWSPSLFFSQVPSKVSHVTVLSLSSPSARSPLYLNVVATFLEKRMNVIICDGKIKSPSLLPCHVQAVIQNAKQDSPKKTFSLCDEILGSDSEALSYQEFDLPSQNSTTVAFWEVDNGSTSFGTFVSSVLSQQDSEVTVNTIFDTYCNVLPSGLVYTSLSFTSPSSLPLTASSDGVSLVVCFNLELFGVYQLLNGLPDGGHLILNLHVDGHDDKFIWETLEASLSPSVKRHLAVHKVQLHVVDAKTIRQKVASVLGEEQQEARAEDDVIRTIIAAVVFNVAYRDPSILYRYVNTYTTQASVEAYELAIDQAGKNTFHLSAPPSWIDIPIDVNEEVTRPVSSISNILPNSEFVKTGSKKIKEETVSLKPWYYSAWHLIFKHCYNTTTTFRPATGHGANFIVKLTKTVRLTPGDYDRNIFHMEIDISGTGLKYAMGEALAVYGHNKTREVEEFLEWYKINPTDLVLIKHAESTEVRTCFQIFQQYLDLFGRPTKKFYQQLAEIATSKNEKDKLNWIISPEGKDEFKERVDETTTFADLLREFTSAKPTVEQMLEIIPAIKPRHYSIASSMKAHPTSVHLLVVVEDWKTPKGKYREGHTSSYLAGLKNLDTQDILLNVMKLPPSNKQPVIMAGLGTGMAPFRAFIQERAFLKSQGEEVGPMALYFGSRHRAKEYLYGEELEAYNASGLLTNLRLAFSRDQVEKVYIQHKIKGDSDTIAKWLLEEKGHFYLCGPTWPAGDVYDAIVSAFVANGQTHSKAQQELQEMKENGRYVLEVY